MAECLGSLLHGRCTARAQPVISRRWSRTGSPLQVIGPLVHVADDLFAGILEGFIGHFAEPGLRCVQTGDRRMGDREGTTFILGFEDSAKRVDALVREKLAHSRIVARLAVV